MRGARRVSRGGTGRALGGAALLLMVALLPVASQQGPAPTVVYLVRHAEVEGGGSDPQLSAAGLQRVEALTDLLLAIQLAGVHTTPYARTRSTAGGPARSHGLEARNYDPARLSELVERIRGEGGHHLVVGHSNTTPALVALLGGEAGPPILETEFDRVYVLIFEGDEVRTRVLRLEMGMASPARAGG